MVDGSWISADFFRTVGVLLVAGRFFSEHDNADAPAVVIINTEAARQFWPGQDPIGKRIGINYTGPGRRTDGSVPRLREVVGVVGSMKHGALDGPTAPAIYMPYLQDETNHDMASMNLLVRTEGNPMGLADSLRNRIHAIQPDQPVDIRTVEELVSQSVAPRRYTLISWAHLRPSAFSWRRSEFTESSPTLRRSALVSSVSGSRSVRHEGESFPMCHVMGRS